MKFEVRYPHTIFTKEALLSFIGKEVPITCEGQQIATGRVVSAELVDGGEGVMIDLDGAPANILAAITDVSAISIERFRP